VRCGRYVFSCVRAPCTTPSATSCGTTETLSRRLVENYSLSVCLVGCGRQSGFKHLLLPRAEAYLFGNCEARCMRIKKECSIVFLCVPAVCL
uniref:Uncharacterized protein n=1 Tax=Anopheles quadriannulatus TaxID=34691 RepID=A0A182XT35_ANOQN